MYVYLSIDGKPKYVGYGESPTRALSHAEESHNDALREWLRKSKFSLNIAGPYRDEAEGKNVESALITSIRPEFNKSLGDGLKFVPLGVPPELGERPSLIPISVAEMGIRTEGVLIVYLSPGEFLKDGRPKFDPTDIDDEVILRNMDRAWEIGKLIDRWSADPASSPRHLVGVYGTNPAHRFIVGCVPIEVEGWGDPALHVYGSRWRVPVKDSPKLDACQLRGIRVADTKFGHMSWQLHIWVDKSGALIHPQPTIARAR